MRQDFVDKCSEHTSAQVCECTMDNVAQSVPFDDFKAFADELGQNPDATQPEWLSSRLSTCTTENPSVSS